MIFPKLSYEKIVQENDKLRLDAQYSFVTVGDEMTDILIEPMVGAGFISVFNGGNSDKWFLDWAYDLAGTFIVKVKIVTVADEKERDFTVEVITKEVDALLSNDNDLFAYEPTIKKYLPVGKSSFTYAHRAAQSKILAYLDEQRIWKNDSSRYTKQDLASFDDQEFREQFRMWSIFQTLLIIFESSQVSSNDVFQEKRIEYEKEMRIHRNRSSLRLDGNDDGTLDPVPRNIRTTRMVRR